MFIFQEASPIDAEVLDLPPSPMKLVTSPRKIQKPPAAAEKPVDIRSTEDGSDVMFAIDFLYQEQAKLKTPPATPPKLLISPKKRTPEKPVRMQSPPRQRARRDSQTESQKKLQELDALLKSANEPQSSKTDVVDQERCLFRTHRNIVALTLDALPPQGTGNETNGSWFLKIDPLAIAGVFKPRLQARGAVDSPHKGQLRAGIPVGQECIREKLAWVVQKLLFGPIREVNPQLFGFGIPHTSIANFRHADFGPHHDVGSFQRFIALTKGLDKLASPSELTSVHEDHFIKAAIFDLMTLNNDRHEGNIMLTTLTHELVLIDHGACFPELKGVKDVDFCWMNYPFAAKGLPEKWKKLILSMNERELLEAISRKCTKESDKHRVKELTISPDAALVFLQAVVLLKAWAASSSSGLSIADFARGFVKLSVPVLTLSTDGTTRKIVLPPTTDIHHFDTKPYCNDIGTDFVDLKRITVGGHYLPFMRDNIEQAKKQLVIRNSLRLMPQNFETFFPLLNRIPANAFKTVQELI